MLRQFEVLHFRSIVVADFTLLSISLAYVGDRGNLLINIGLEVLLIFVISRHRWLGVSLLRLCNLFNRADMSLFILCRLLADVLEILCNLLLPSLFFLGAPLLFNLKSTFDLLCCLPLLPLLALTLLFTCNLLLVQSALLLSSRFFLKFLAMHHLPAKSINLCVLGPLKLLLKQRLMR